MLIVNHMVNYSIQPEIVFQALADPTRRAMVERLSRRPMPVAELAEPFDMSAPAISKHLRVLDKAGLLRREIRGRVHICHLCNQPLNEALSWLEEQRRFWEQNLDKLERYFEADEPKEKTNAKRPARRQ